MFLTIHQPEFMPWPAFFDKIIQTDHFVVLDTVKYQKNYFLNRCRIKQNGKAHWLTVPVAKEPSDTKIRDKILSRNASWARKTLSTITQCYSKSPFWKDHEAFLQYIFNGEKWDYLADLNLATLAYFCAYLSIPFNYTRSGDLELAQTGSELILEICQAMGATSYLSGTHGKEYLDVAEFTKLGISVKFQEYDSPVYQQFNGEFCGPLSVIDMLLNHGPDSLQIIKSGRRN